jgi:hypothetical protein
MQSGHEAVQLAHFFTEFFILLVEFLVSSYALGIKKFIFLWRRFLLNDVD